MIRVISGLLKGRRIEFNNKKFDSADISPQMLKEAFFSIIDNKNKGGFLDLFAGSGQIGIEALSRGFLRVDFVELNYRRFQFIKQTVDSFGLSGRASFNHMSVYDFLKNNAGRNVFYDIIYADPPYEKISGKADSYRILLEEIKMAGIVSDDTLIVLQHFGKNDIEYDNDFFMCHDKRNYGTSSISFFGKK